MIEAKEVRIGNYINYFGKQRTVIKIAKENSQFYIGCSDSVNNLINTYNVQDSYDSIPLTEQWLLKFGFVKDIIADDIWFIHENGDMMICGDRMYLSNNEFSVKEMPVHRLQNLYYFFHNEELTIC